MKTAFLFCATLILVSACASNQHRAEKIETKLENTSKVGRNSTIGVKDGDLVFQRKALLSEDLRRLEIDVYSLEDRIYGHRRYGSRGMYGVLKGCRKKLASREFGGEGKLMWTEPIDRVTEKESQHTEIGISDDDKLITVSEEYIKDRIRRFKGYRDILRQREDEYVDKVDICEAELQSRMYESRQSDRASY